MVLLEREATEPPSTLDEAANGWARPTVPQAAHSHAFGSRGTNILREKLPDVYAALVEAGAGEVNLANFTPPTLGPVERVPSDDLLNMLTVRRSTFEWVLRDQALARDGVSLRTGATVRGLVTDGDRVTGVRLSDGTELTADLVLDASGRKTSSAKWLEEAGLPVPEAQSESCRITYYTRYYRRLSPQPPGPLNRGFGAGGMWDSYTAVLFLGEGDTFSLSIGVLPDDKPMKNLREEAAFTAAIRATPLLAGWVAPGNSEPISPVYAMGGLDNSSRFVDPGADRLTHRVLRPRRLGVHDQPGQRARRLPCPGARVRAGRPARGAPVGGPRPGGQVRGRHQGAARAVAAARPSPTTAAVPGCGRPSRPVSGRRCRRRAWCTSVPRSPRPQRTPRSGAGSRR